jgi:hypothetical protein
MGNNLASDKNYGSISIQLDRLKYTAGEQVNGWVHLSLVKTFPSNVVHLVISGKERVKLATTKQVAKDGRLQDEAVLHKDKTEFYSHNFPLHTYPGKNFPPGQYSFPFSFKLNDSMPGTFVHEYTKHGEKCYGKVQYKIKVGMKDNATNKALFEKCPFIVDQAWKLPTGTQSVNISKYLQGYCYANLGKFEMTCFMEKDRFSVGGNSNFTFSVDNSDCKSDVTNIRCQLVQVIRLQTSTLAVSDVINKDLNVVLTSGVLAGQKRVGLESLTIIFPIKLEGDLEASCAGSLIQNEFRIIVSADMGKLICLGQVPYEEIEIKVLNRGIQGQPLAPQQPPNWAPTVMDPYVCTISSESRMNPDFMQNMSNQLPPNPSNQLPPNPSNQLPPNPSNQFPPNPSNQLPPNPTSQLPPNPSNQLPPNPSNQLPPNPSNQLPPNPSNQLPFSPSNQLPPNPSNQLPPNPSNQLPPNPFNQLPPNPSSQLPPNPSNQLPPNPFNQLPPNPSNQLPPNYSNDLQNQYPPNPSN